MSDQQEAAATGEDRELNFVAWAIAWAVVGALVLLVFLAAGGVLRCRDSDPDRKLVKSGIERLRWHLETYAMETDTWPSVDLGFEALSDGHAPPTAVYYVRPEYLLDPWGNPYQLIMPGPFGLPYEIRSLGADGVPGGTGQDADISNLD